MCYDIKVSLERQLKVARQYGDKKVIEEIEKNLLPLLNPIERELYEVSGFSHPKVFILKNDGIIKPVLSQWGLIPAWTKDIVHANDIMNKTLNARIEGILNKPSYREAAREGRCVIIVDGFYEYRHVGNKAYPYYIFNKDGSTINLAGLSEEWVDPETGEVRSTFTILTRKANKFMSIIHNNPKLPEPRMPMILDNNESRHWLEDLGEKELEDTVHEYAGMKLKSELKAHTVRPIKGKGVIPNSKNASEEYIYPELEDISKS